MANTELQFEMAMRDQVIHNQREALRNMWNLLMGLGLDERQIFDLAARQGITIEDWTVTPYLGLSDRKQPLSLDSGRLEPLRNCPNMEESFLTTSCILQHCQDLGSRSFSREHWDSASTFCREEHHASDYFMSHDHPPSSFLKLGRSEHWVGGRPSSSFGTSVNHPQNLRHSYPGKRTHSSSYGESCLSSSSRSADFGNRRRVSKLNIRHRLASWSLLCSHQIVREEFLILWNFCFSYFPWSLLVYSVLDHPFLFLLVSFRLKRKAVVWFTELIYLDSIWRWHNGKRNQMHNH